MTANRYNVAKRRWSKWTDDARVMFNELMDDTRNQASFNSAPKTVILGKDAWDCVRWNIAFWGANNLSKRQNGSETKRELKKAA